MMKKRNANRPAEEDKDHEEDAEDDITMTTMKQRKKMTKNKMKRTPT